VQEVDLNRPLVERPTRLTRKADDGRTPANHHQIRVADLVRLSVGHHQTEGLEGLRSQDVA